MNTKLWMREGKTMATILIFLNSMRKVNKIILKIPQYGSKANDFGTFFFRIVIVTAPWPIPPPIISYFQTKQLPSDG
jgi:hypothetical protein